MATIRDVARASGVSIATVSRVTNGSTRVSEETRRRVWEAALKFGYWPNGAARSLTTNRTNTIGVLLPDLYGEFFSEIIRGIDRAARSEKIHVLISSSHADMDTILSAAYSMHGRVDGLIVMAPEEASGAAIEQIRQRFPVVLLNPPQPANGCGMVSIDNMAGAHAVARHVLELGHRRIALLKGPAGNVDAEERLRGYRKALKEARMNEEAVIEVPGDFTEASGEQAAGYILDQPLRPTAILAANDYMAIGLMGALRDARVHVPDEMTVCGFDDIPIARYVRPPLTTVHVDAVELGKKAMELLLAGTRDADSGRPRRDVLPATLVVRGSSGPCGGGKDPASRSSLRIPRRNDGHVFR